MKTGKGIEKNCLPLKAWERKKGWQSLMKKKVREEMKMKRDAEIVSYCV